MSSTYLLDSTIEKFVTKDRSYLKKTHIPIISVSGSFREDLKGLHGMPENESISDVVYSRAHYSMALAILVEAWGMEPGKQPINDYSYPDLAWLVDPTNYVTKNHWSNIVLTEKIGKLIARWPLLQTVKGIIDTKARSKLPILDSITPPLLQLTHDLRKPILSFHIAAGNILVGQGHTVLQVITDPHVRSEYVTNADNPNLYFAVFDTKTMYELMEISSLHGKHIDSNRIIVTGPPVDPRIIACRNHKHAWRNGPLKLCLTTGGIGTNKQEIALLLEQLLPAMRQNHIPLQLLVYAGTHPDIASMVTNLAAKYRVRIGDEGSESAQLRLLYHPQLVDANELLISYGFPWADCFITKPSGDMAYDAAASGSCILTLTEWGEWEHNVREVFEQKGIARRADTNSIISQLLALTATNKHHTSWVEQAMTSAFKLDRLFLEGSKNIVAAYKQL